METVQKVMALMTDCLHGSQDGALVVDGIVRKFGFSSEKVAARSDEIREILDDMPEQFHAAHGGGWSFLNLCIDKNGRQWTGEHRAMEALVALGIAAGMASYVLPREMWHVMPGGMPYVVFDTVAQAHERSQTAQRVGKGALS